MSLPSSQVDGGSGGGRTPPRAPTSARFRRCLWRAVPPRDNHGPLGRGRNGRLLPIGAKTSMRVPQPLEERMNAIGSAQRSLGCAAAAGAMGGGGMMNEVRGWWIWGGAYTFILPRLRKADRWIGEIRSGWMPPGGFRMNPRPCDCRMMVVELTHEWLPPGGHDSHARHSCRAFSSIRRPGSRLCDPWRLQAATPAATPDGCGRWRRSAVGEL